MDSIDSIKTIFPTLKQQLLFLRERNKIFDEQSTRSVQQQKEPGCKSPQKSIHTGDSSLCSAILDSELIANPRDTSHRSEISLDGIRNNSASPKNDDFKSMNNLSSKLSLPDNYCLPPLPSSLLDDIGKGDLSKFNNHCRNRQILIETIFHDLTERYNLWLKFY